MGYMEPHEKLRALAVVLLLVGGVGWWLLKPTSREALSVPQGHVEETTQAKGKLDERKYAKEGEGGSFGTTKEAPGGADMERLGLAKPEPPVVTDDMKAKGLGPIGTDKIH